MTIDLIGLDDRVPDSPRKRGGVGGLLHLSKDNCELVAAQTRNHIKLSNTAAQPAGNEFQQLVPDRMSKSIVDALEMIEVQAQHGQTLAPLDPFELMFEPLAQ